MPDRHHFFDLDRDALRALVAEWGLPTFRADQLLEWVYRRHVVDPERMTNLSKADRLLLSEKLRFESARIVQQQLATDGTQKLLLEWDTVESRLGKTALPIAGANKSDPRNQTECVMIPTDARRTACVSSQVGCPVGCRFCASGLGGLDGNLTAGQIVEQVWRLGAGETRPPLPLGEGWGEGSRRVSTHANDQGLSKSPHPNPPKGEGTRISHVVFMGMGEPLANFDQVTRAVGTLMADWGLGISGRRITISTVGLPAQMRRLADMKLPVTLAISLHAPNDQIRRQLIPWAEYVTIEQLLDAGRYYFDKTGREITLEYILLHGVNDQADHARELSHVAQTLRANVNLIRYNEVSPLPFERPLDEDVRRFQDILRRAGVNTHIRASRGRDIAAACGQLRHEHAATG